MKYALLIYGDKDLVEEVEQLSEEEQRSVVDEFLVLRAEEPGIYGAYGHLARDGHEHVITLIDVLNASGRSTYFASVIEGRRAPRARI